MVVNGYTFTSLGWSSDNYYSAMTESRMIENGLSYRAIGSSSGELLVR